MNLKNNNTSVDLACVTTRSAPNYGLVAIQQSDGLELLSAVFAREQLVLADVVLLLAMQLVIHAEVEPFTKQKKMDYRRLMKNLV